MCSQGLVIALWTITGCFAALGISNKLENGVNNMSLKQTSLRGGNICKQKNCTCQNFTVNCEHASLRQIPPNLPPETKRLELAGNHIERLDSSQFESIQKLEYLDLSSNSVTHIADGTFRNLHSFITLNLRNNIIDARSLMNGLCSLDANNVSLDFAAALAINISEQSQFVFSSFKCLEGKRVSKLHLSNNHVIQLINDGLLSKVSTEKLYLDNVSDGDVTLNINKLNDSIKTLDLRYNKLVTIPIFHNGGISILPNLSVLEIGFNYFDRLLPESFIGLESITSLDFNWNLAIIQNVRSDTFKNLPRLTYISLKYCKILNLDNLPCMFESDSLEQLDISRLKIMLAIKREKVSYFACAPYLKRLSLARIKIESLTGYKMLLRRGFQNMYQLEYLDIRDTGLENLDLDMFLNMSNLLSLQLSANFLTTWPPEVFINVPSLTDLGLWGNHIQTINQTSFPMGFIDQLDMLKLKYNPLHCNCGLFWFMQYVHKHLNKTRTWIPRGNTSCSYPPSKVGLPVIEFNPNFNECVLSPFPIEFYFVIGFSCCTFVVFLVSAILFKYRWSIKFWYFQMRSRYENHIQVDNRFEFKYDAFISYSYKDVSWIKRHLLPYFENELGFRFCLHDRDWIAGKDIVDNIFDSVTASHKVVLIVSNAFAASQWCQLELTMAQHQLFAEDKNRLILIILEDIHKDNMYPRLAHQMKTQTYIKWTEGEEAKKVLFAQLNSALKRKNLSIHKQPV